MGHSSVASCRGRVRDKAAHCIIYIQFPRCSMIIHIGSKQITWPFFLILALRAARGTYLIDPANGPVVEIIYIWTDSSFNDVAARTNDAGCCIAPSPGRPR